jgi:hypothetical protein
MLLLFHAFGQRRAVRFLNAGKMYTGALMAGDTILFVDGSMKTVHQALTAQMGTTAITGSFFHDAQTHAFNVDAAGWGTSTGRFIFMDGAKPSAGKMRYIDTEKPDDMATFDRSSRYIAFPHLLIGTNDTLSVPGRMGLDAASIHRSAGKTGRLVLRSDGDTVVYDASLRISGSGKSSAALVDAGSVLVERNIVPYRIKNQADKTPADYPLFAFASPMVAMKSGYFAGNWIRKLKTDDANYGHVRYVYGNESADGKILVEQYLWNPAEAFEAGKGYLIKARPEGYDFNEIRAQAGLFLTGADVSFYNKGKFIFDGNIYEMQHNVDEQLFAEDTLFAKTINGQVKRTINWIVGNSWTSAIRVDSLIGAIRRSPLSFEPRIYVWPAGSSTYQTYTIPTTAVPDPIQTIELRSIPSQSLFMIRALSDAQAGHAQLGAFTLCKRSMQTHSRASHNRLRSASTPDYRQEVLFRASLEANDNLYDVTAIGMRAGAKETFDDQDVAKMYQGNSSVFQLYTLSSDNRQLSSNAVPFDVRQVRLCLDPGDNGGRMKIVASRTESLERIWLEDRLTGQIIDLKEEASYHFLSSPTDAAERFTVHFDRSTATDNVVSDAFLQCYYSRDEIVVKGLKTSDHGAKIFISDMQGRILRQTTVDREPELRIPIQIKDGVYIVHLNGNRNVTVKFGKKETA